MKDLFLALLENWFERRRCVLGESRLETIVISLRAKVSCFSLSDEDMTPGRQLVICTVRSVVRVSIKACIDNGSIVEGGRETRGTSGQTSDTQAKGYLRA